MVGLFNTCLLKNRKNIQALTLALAFFQYILTGRIYLIINLLIS